MDAPRGLIPHPTLSGSLNRATAGSRAHSERPLPILDSCRPDASSTAFSLMLGLLEILQNLVLSGHEPAAFLIAPLDDGRLVMVAGEDAQLSPQHGSAARSFRVSTRPAAAGVWLTVEQAAGGDHRLEQFCRRDRVGRYEALPHSWTRSRASSAYHSTSGLIPYWGFRNSSLLNHRMC